MSGSVNPTFLQNLANPPAASPDYWTKQMANMNALQDYNAKEATADAYRQSIDPTTGQPDPVKFNLLLARGPGAWNAAATMQAQGQAQRAQNTAQYEQASSLYNLTGQLSASAMKDTSDANMAAIRARAVSVNAPPGVIAEIDRIAALPENQRADEAYNHNVASLDAMERLHRQLGETTAQNIGGQNVAQTVTQGSPGQPGSVTQGPGGITRTLTPESATDLMDVKYPDNTIHQVMRQDLPAELGKGGTVIGPSAGSVSSSEAPVNAAGDSATRKASEGGPPAPGTPAAAVAQRTHDFWISQGYNEAQVAGILAGGPGSESDFNPSVSGDKGTSYGLYQHHADRLAAMQKYFGLSGNQMPSEAQQNQYAAYEISPQGPLAAVGAQLKQATTPAQASAIWTRSFGVPGDKTEIGRRANGAQRYAGIYAQPAQGPQGGQQTPPATTPPVTTTTPPAATPTPPASPFGASAFAQPSTALPAPASQATAPNTTAAVPAVPTPQKAAAMAIAQRTGRPAPIAGTDGLFVDKNGNVGSGPNAGGLGRRADIPNALLAGVQTAQTTMPPANVLTAGPGAPTTGLPSGAAPTAPPANAFGTGAFGSAPAAAPVTPPPPVVQPPAQAVPPQAQRGAGWSAPPGYVETLKNDIETRTQASLATGDQRKTLQAGESALEALHLAQGYTGPGTGVSARMYAFLQAHDPTGALPQGNMSDTAWRQVMAKNLIRFAASAGLRSNTDKSLEEQLHGTANVDDILPTANEHVLVQDIGNARQRMAQTMLMPPSSGNGDVINHFRNYTGDTDPRGFAIDLMSQPERDAIEKDLKRPGNEKALARFTRAVHDGIATGLVRQP